MPELSLLKYSQEEIKEWVQPVVSIIGMEPEEIYSLQSSNGDENGYFLTILHFPVGTPAEYAQEKAGMDPHSFETRIMEELDREWLDEGAMDLKLIWGHSSLLVILSGLI